MGLFNNIFKKQGGSEKPLKDATALLSLAKGVAVSSYLPLLDRFPDLKVITIDGQLEKLDFLLTVAGVGVAFSRLASSVKEGEIEDYSLAIKKVLDSWDKSAYLTLAEFTRYMMHLLDHNTISDFDKFKEAVGAWVLLKLSEDPKSSIAVKDLANRYDFFLAIGHNPCATFSNYWKEIGVV